MFRFNFVSNKILNCFVKINHKLSFFALLYHEGKSNKVNSSISTYLYFYLSIYNCVHSLIKWYQNQIAFVLNIIKNVGVKLQKKLFNLHSTLKAIVICNKLSINLSTRQLTDTVLRVSPSSLFSRKTGAL